MFIFTPTHMALISETDDPAGKKTFSNSVVGTYTLAGNKYLFTPVLASWTNDPKEKGEYTYKIGKDTFTGSGTVTAADGTSYKAKHTYRHLNLPHQETGEVLGTWKEPQGQPEVRLIQVLTPFICSISVIMKTGDSTSCKLEKVFLRHGSSSLSPAKKY